MKNRFLTSKDYARLYEKARRVLDREISKPSDEWDEGLIEELEETMLYCAERKKVLYSEEKEKRSLQPSFKIRRVAVVVIAVLAVLALSATIAQASGFRVWSAIVYWDINYLRVDYTGNPSEKPDDDNISNSNEPIEEEDAITTDFDSLEALVAYMDGKALLLAEIDELQFVSARVTKDEEMTILHTKYLLDGDSIVIDMISSESPDYDALFHSQTDYSNYDNVSVQSINGIECVFAQKDGKGYCSFNFEESVYQIICNEGEDSAISLVRSMLKGVSR